MRPFLRALAVAGAVALFPSPLPAATLATGVVTDGGCEGAFFDLTAKVADLRITGFQTNLVGTANVRVYYKAGTYQGFENDPSLWHLLGSQTIAGGAGVSQVLFPLDVGGLVVPAGQTYGFLVYSGGNSSTVLATRYRVGTNVTVEDPLLRLFGGSSSCGGDPQAPFDGSLSPRAWHGVVAYVALAGQIPALGPAPLAVLALAVLAAGAWFSRRRA